jgi:hypothetical protein
MIFKYWQLDCKAGHRDFRKSVGKPTINIYLACIKYLGAYQEVMKMFTKNYFSLNLWYLEIKKSNLEKIARLVCNYNFYAAA